MALPGDYLSRAIENSNRMRQSAATTGYQAGMQKYGIDTQKAIADQNLQLQRDRFNLEKMLGEYAFNRAKRQDEVMDNVLHQANINRDLLDEQQKLMEDTEGWRSEKEYDQYSHFFADKHGTDAFRFGNLKELARNIWGLFAPGQTWDSAYDPEIYEDLTYEGKPAAAKLQEEWKYIKPEDLKGAGLRLQELLSPYVESANIKNYSDKRLRTLLELAQGGQ